MRMQKILAVLLAAALTTGAVVVSAAEDVKYSFERILDPAGGPSPYEITFFADCSC